MRNSVITAVLLMILGAALLVHPSTPVAAQEEPQALTPSPEPPTPTDTAIPTTPPEPTATTTAVPTAEPTATPETEDPAPPPRPPEDERLPDPTISTRGSATEVRPGDLLSFDITVTNIGQAAAEDVVARDGLPGVLSVYNATPTPIDNCVRTAAGGEPLPTCTAVPGTPVPPHPTTPPHPTVVSQPQRLPDSGAAPPQHARPVPARLRRAWARICAAPEGAG